MIRRLYLLCTGYQIFTKVLCQLKCLNNWTCQPIPRSMWRCIGLLATASHILFPLTSRSAFARFVSLPPTSINGRVDLEKTFHKYFFIRAARWSCRCLKPPTSESRSCSSSQWLRYQDTDVYYWFKTLECNIICSVCEYVSFIECWELLATGWLQAKVLVSVFIVLVNGSLGRFHSPLGEDLLVIPL
jgi:hypothetical protein